jgi:TRAP-type C4-dicarboxylate transport system substrate-binding protein
LWAESEAYSLRELKKAGVEIVYPDKKMFEDMVKPVYDYYRTNREMDMLINQIKIQ